VRFRRIVKPILDRAMPPLWRWYVRKPRRTKMEGLVLWVPVGVFHPKLFLSTRFMIRHLRGHSLAGKTLLEIGAGSGAVALVAAKLGAQVTATDISAIAVEAIQQNAAANGLAIQVVHSDLFEDLPRQTFDFVAVNPPYYPGNPQNEAEYAWFCGLEFEYFQRLFQGLNDYCHTESQVLMVLSEDCRFAEIAAIARTHGWEMIEVARRRRLAEWNYIYAVRIDVRRTVMQRR
jgi:release factor glutamine methyltransferase